MTNYSPEVWLEDPVPPECVGCKMCGLYLHGTRMVWGEGNPDADLYILLDNPGAREDSQGKVFVCGTRDTLQQALYAANLDQSNVYITYIIKRRPRKKYDKEKTRVICMQHLEQQLQNKKPKIIVCLGNVAIQSFSKDTTADVKAMRGTWHVINGYRTAVAYHPLAVRRRPNLWNGFLQDIQSIAAEIKKGGKHPI